MQTPRADEDRTTHIQQLVLEACASGRPLRLRGAGTKDFYGRAATGEILSLAEHRGIIAYEPSELVVTARAGTALAEVESLLAGSGQALAFEPPRFGPNATLGGTMSAGLAGPARYWRGAPRDHVLGVRLINGRGDDMRFGGQVMKNVAGYDISRLVAGALGTLGIITELSLKVLPMPRSVRTTRLTLDTEAALGAMTKWARRPLPITGTCHVDGQLHVRLSGAPAATEAALAEIGGEVSADQAIWASTREHQHPFFAGDIPLWRLAVPDGTPPLPLDGPWLLEWCGTQRWLRSAQPATTIRQCAAAVGGHATLFRGGDRHSEVFQPLPPALADVHRRLKQALDPHSILNPGRLYADL